jgi:hypothetical protein
MIQYLSGCAWPGNKVNKKPAEAGFCLQTGVD